MKYQHIRFSEFHFGFIKNIEVFQADIIFFVEETFLLDSGHIKNVQILHHII